MRGENNTLCICPFQIALIYAFTCIYPKGADFPALSRASVKKRSKSSRSEKENHKKKDGCRKKLDYSTKKLSNKPPLSYAALIALAICSTPQRMMTLSSIYRWIETTFPFYCTPEAKAWKVRVTSNRCQIIPLGKEGEEPRKCR